MSWIVFGFGVGFFLGGLRVRWLGRKHEREALRILADAERTQQLASEWISMLAHTRAAEAIFSGPSLRDRQNERPA